jgi:hypothetical protein
MNTYQHNTNDMAYNNGIRPVLPSASSSATNSNNMFQKNFRSSSGSNNYHSPTTVCPVILSTYITLHLDTTHKVLNHILYLTLLCDIMLLLSSFSISYFNNIGYNTVLCTFILCTITIITLLIINNNHISALSILAPTQYMIGMATGITISAIMITFLIFTTYKSTIKICIEVLKTSSSIHSNNSTGSDSALHHYYNDDPVLIDACKNHGSTMSSIRFWSSLIGWCNVMTTALLVVGRHELSAHTTTAAAQYAYDPISTTMNGSTGAAGGPNHHHHHSNSHDTAAAEYPPGYDFEEQFRQQQAQILGAQGVAAIQQRATAMFVGDYSTIPEVTQQPQVSRNDGPQILSV